MVAAARGILPKARKPFAIFTKDQMNGPPYAGRPFTACMAAIVAEWRALPPEKRQEYQDKSKQEWATNINGIEIGHSCPLA